jgi:uncharacterized membrane protein
MIFIQRVLHDLVSQAPHAAFVHFPIALVSSSLFFILLAIFLKNETLEKVAFANISLAAASTVVAGAMGIRDNIAFYAGLAPNHTAKIIIASTLFVITTSMALARWRKPDLLHSRAGWLYLSGFFVSFVLVFVLGFLGAIILYGF